VTQTNPCVLTFLHPILSILSTTAAGEALIIIIIIIVTLGTLQNTQVSKEEKIKMSGIANKSPKCR
jgi:hypothetical protein